MSEGLERTLALLDVLPNERACALLLRHAERPDLPPELLGSEAALTLQGRADACRLGEVLVGRLASLATSPTLRCRQTADEIARGSRRTLTIADDFQLGGPGVFVIDEERAAALWHDWGHEQVFEHLLHGRGTAPGLADPALACERLVAHLDATLDRVGGVHVFVTHDSVLGPVLARRLDPAWGRPDYLDALAVWRDDDGLVLHHRR